MVGTKRLVIALMFLAALVAPAWAEVKGLVVIVHSSNTARALDTETLVKIFTGKLSTFPTGGRAEPVDQAEEGEAYGFFAEKVHQKGVNTLKAFWARQIFSGAGSPPRRLPTDLDVLEYVAKTPEAIGYVKEGVDLKGVRAILIDERPVLK